MTMQGLAMRTTGGLLCVLAGMAGGVVRAENAAPAAPPSSAVSSDPAAGTVVNGAYVNAYFDLSYPLPAGWTQGMEGPEPSRQAYYSLTMLVPANGSEKADVLIAAQDAFFAPEGLRDAAAMVRSIGDSMSKISGTTIDRQPAEVTIAGRPFSRIDFSGAGLYRSVLATTVRCHILSFNVTANSAAGRMVLVASLDRLGPADPEGAAKPPACKPNLAAPDRVVTRVDPPAIAPFAPIPVRLIAGADGGVKQVHVVRATKNQRIAIEAALREWKLKPFETNGGAVEVETGLILQLTSTGAVKYMSGDNAPPY